MNSRQRSAQQELATPLTSSKTAQIPANMTGPYATLGMFNCKKLVKIRKQSVRVELSI